MKWSKLLVALLTAAFVVVIACPVVAFANPYVIERSIMGFDPDFPTIVAPDISGGTIIYGMEPSGGARTLKVFSLARGIVTSTLSNGAWDILSQAVSGDWVVYGSASNIHAKNLKTGAYRAVTSDGATNWNGQPAVSTADGAYTVWYRQDAGQYDVMGRNLAGGSVFTVAGGAGNQTVPAIYGKRVAYIDNKTGTDNVWVKTIGSSAAPLHVTDDGHLQAQVDIGNHLVVWTATNADGHQALRYYDYNTGLYANGPSNPLYDVVEPQVSGDRILYSISNGANLDLNFYDTRIAKLHPTEASFPIATTTNSDRYGRIEGDKFTYTTGNIVYYARLAVPGISLNSVPKRIPHKGHIHLKGSISDQGIRIGGASLGIEKYSSGKWTRIKTLTASSTGTFSYQTPHNHSKTKYRVVYDGKLDHFGAQSADHLSTVSAVKTAWPR
jgi:hypothetical protein